ncbi:MAG: transporter [Glaciihabitans sp.]|nr:transporter [Glaciihabitans sp.]
MPTPVEGRIPPRAWVALALGVLTQAAGTVLLSTPAFLIPLLHTRQGVPLASAGLFAAAPSLGMVVTLVAWGALADRIGERWVIAGGIGLAGIAIGLGALFSAGVVVLGILFFVGGMAAASCNAASGRLVVGWFPTERRGLAMGIRQMSQPLGVAIAAVTVPGIASGSGVSAAAGFAAVLCLAMCLLDVLFLRDPARHPSTGYHADAVGNPYRRSGVLARIHAVSLLLVIPQYTLATFGLVWLITDQSLAAGAAGAIVGGSQFLGAIGRIGSGVLSDGVRSRMRPLRWVAFAAVGAMGLLAALDAAHSVAAIALFVLATTISVADNGLAFTAVAEYAGPRWSGRALGVQNTGQYLAAFVVGPAAGALIALVGYPLTFVASGLTALVAVPLVPVDSERRAAALHGQR